MFASQVKVKNFCERATLDERALFFYNLGLDFGITLFVDKTKAGVALKDIWDSLHEKKLSIAVKQAAEFGVYVTTDKDTSFYMGLIGQTLNNDTFLRTLEFNKTGYNIRGWTRQLSSQATQEFAEVEDNAKLVNMTLMNASISFMAASDLYKMNEVDMSILMFFYDKRSAYVSRETVDSKFHGYIPSAKIYRSVKRLMLSGYIRKHIDYRNLQHTITAQGIKTVNEFISNILKLNEF